MTLDEIKKRKSYLYRHHWELESLVWRDHLENEKPGWNKEFCKRWLDVVQEIISLEKLEEHAG